MKIGEFARKHSVTIGTVRHYIDEGLLTPLKENSQFRFSDIDDDVMDSILVLKSMNFKLEEMKAYLLFQTMYTNNTFRFLGSFRQNFIDKLNENKKEIERLERVNKVIENRLGANEGSMSFSRGISIRLIGDFTCAECGEQLELVDPTLIHNEIIEGSLICPKCNKKYYIRYGILSNKPISDIEDRTADLSDLLNNYLKINDNNYIFNIRSFFQKIADITRKNSASANTVLIDGDTGEFMNGSIIRSIPKSALLIIHCKDNVTTKLLLEEIFPSSTIFYIGDMAQFPLKVSVDYINWQDYDIDSISEKKIRYCWNISSKARIDCFKSLFYDSTIPFSGEKQFLQDMESRGWNLISSYKTGKLLNKKDSSDWDIFEKKKDVEMEYCIYSFKTSG